MKCLAVITLLVHATKATLEQSASCVHIQNYDGPIYVNPGEKHVTTLSNTSTRDHKPSTHHNLAIKNHDNPATIDHRNLATYDHHNLATKNHNNLETIDHRNLATYDHHNLATSDRYNPTQIHLSSFDNQHDKLHSSVPYHHSICETDCKCVTKQQTYVPVAVNAVPQNTCTPGYYTSSTQYPDGCYGYGYPGYTESDVCSPKTSEVLIPILKAYLSQAPKRACTCGHNH